MNSLFGTGESVTWSPDDRYIATGDDSASNFVHIWDWQENKSIYNAQQPSQLRTIAWSPSGKYLAFGTISDKIVRAKVQVLDVSDITNASSVLIYTGHSESVQEITWSPDSKFIASASAVGTVQIWNALDKSVRFIYTGHSAMVWSVAWSPDGKSIASGDSNGEVHIWNVPPVSQKSASEVFNFSFYGLAGHICARTLSWSYDSNYLVAGSWNKTVIVVRPCFGMRERSSVIDWKDEYELSQQSHLDAEWKCLQRHLPPQSKRGRPPTHSLRSIFDAIFYILRTGCPWRYLPTNFPPWQTVFYHFRCLRDPRHMVSAPHDVARSRTQTSWEKCPAKCGDH